LDRLTDLVNLFKGALADACGAAMTTLPEQSDDAWSD